MGSNKEIVVPKEFKTSKNGFVTPLPEGFENLDDFEMFGTFPIIVFSADASGGKEDKRREEKDRGDSYLVGDLGD